MTTPTPQQIAAIRACADAITEAVKAAGSHGAPAGVMYAALCDRVTLPQFESFMAAMVNAGRLTKRGHLYFIG